MGILPRLFVPFEAILWLLISKISFGEQARTMVVVDIIRLYFCTIFSIIISNFSHYFSFAMILVFFFGKFSMILCTGNGDFLKITIRKNAFQMEVSQIKQIMVAHRKTHWISLDEINLFNKNWQFSLDIFHERKTMFFLGSECGRKTTHKSTYRRRLRRDEFHSRQCSRNNWTRLKWIVHTNADAQHKQFSIFQVIFDCGRCS